MFLTTSCGNNLLGCNNCGNVNPDYSAYNVGNPVQVSNWMPGNIYFRKGLGSNPCYLLAYYDSYNNPVAAFYNENRHDVDQNWLWSWGFYRDNMGIEHEVQVIYHKNNQKLFNDYLFGQYPGLNGYPGGWPAQFSPTVLGYAGGTIKWSSDNKIPYIIGNNIQGIVIKIDLQIRKV